MTNTDKQLSVTLRIPAPWSHPSDLFKRLPDGFRLTEKFLMLPDDRRVEIEFAQPDDQFADVFRSACRSTPTQDEIKTIENYAANCLLTGHFDFATIDDHLDAARLMMQAGAAIVRAGGGGVFIDNGAVSHGGQQWIAMTEDGGVDAMSFAFAAVVGGKTETWTMGMHVLGKPDIAMRSVDISEDGSEIIEMIQYLCVSDRPIADGHILADEQGPRFKAKQMPDEKKPAR